VSGTISIVVASWKALTTHTTVADAALRSCAIVGSATLEIVPSRTLRTVVMPTVKTMNRRLPAGRPSPY
jgi:hypothetical protein